MTLTCAQMEILISFYLEDELSSTLKKQVEEHLNSCEICSSKYSLIKAMVSEIKETVNGEFKEETDFTNNEPYKAFRTNLSAYMDNELPDEENIRIKKFAIKNSRARKELEDSYNIRKLMNDSFKKSKDEAKADYSRNIIRQLEADEKSMLNFHPAVRFLIIFTISTIVFAAIVLISLNL